MRDFDIYGNESGNSNEVALPLLLLSPLDGSESAQAPTFQWTPGPCEFYRFCSLFYYPGVGYYRADICLTDDFSEMPASWWNKIEAGHPCYRGVIGINQTTGYWEYPGYLEFTKTKQGHEPASLLFFPDSPRGDCRNVTHQVDSR